MPSLLIFDTCLPIPMHTNTISMFRCWSILLEWDAPKKMGIAKTYVAVMSRSTASLSKLRRVLCRQAHFNSPCKTHT